MDRLFDWFTYTVISDFLETNCFHSLDGPAGLGRRLVLMGQAWRSMGLQLNTTSGQTRHKNQCTHFNTTLALVSNRF